MGNPTPHPALWSDLHAKVHQTLRSRQILPPHSRLLIAVSGGQDSLCLLRLLLDLQPKWHWHLIVAHCDHRWPSDVGIVEFVTQQTTHWQLPLICVSAVIPPQGEAGARAWRYEALNAIAIAQQCPIVVTGHTASDRAETLLFNLVRGSGLAGLQALPWKRPMPFSTGSQRSMQLVRPLLNLTRQTTGQFCQARQIPVWQDITNCDRRFARPRLRQDVIPYLRQHLNPQVETTLAQTAEVLSAEVDYLDQVTQALYDRAVVYVDQSWKLHRPLLKSAHLALQRRVIRQLLIRLMPTHPSFDHIEKIVALISAPNRSQSDPLPGGAIAQVDHDWIYFR
ncbi:MAG: tRNA lysidine(34) synthetase TilS [Cyanobacteria bacterium J06635_15]